MRVLGKYLMLNSIVGSQRFIGTNTDFTGTLSIPDPRGIVNQSWQELSHLMITKVAWNDQMTFGLMLSTGD